MRFLFLAAIPALLSAAILPSNVGPLVKGVSTAPVLEHNAVWSEYGLQDSEQAAYTGGGRSATVRAYRLQDATGALAAYQWQRPAGAKDGDAKLQELSKLSATFAHGELVALGNHLLVFEGYQPTADELATVFRSLPHQQAGPLPSLPEYLPGDGLIAGSERYIMGPASLALFAPEVSPGTAAFHLGTEIQLGQYRGRAGDLKLAVFSFPTPGAARERAALLEKTPKSIVKRTGPLVGVVFNPVDSNAAEKVLAPLRYQAEVTTGQKPPTKKDNWGNFLVNLFILIGIVLAFCVLSGFLFGGLRSLIRRGGETGEGDAMITLHLEDR